MTGKHGNFTMSDEWFSEFVYEIMVDKKYLSNKILRVLKTKPVLLFGIHLVIFYNFFYLISAYKVVSNAM